MKDNIHIFGYDKIGGEVTCGGAKNLVTKVMVASVLARGKSRISGVPNIIDVVSVVNMMRALGIAVEQNGDVMHIDSAHVASSLISEDSLGSRISVLFLSVLGHFFDEVRVPMPIGCDLGGREIDMHLEILNKFGFAIEIQNNMCTMRRKSERVKGQSITLRSPSVGATETAIMLSVLAKGKSTIHGIALEPEINALILFLQKCGACIRYVGDRSLLIEGVEKLNPCNFKIMGDRIEAASWACLACATDSEIIVRNIDPQNLVNFFGPFMSIGGGFEIIDDDVVRFYRAHKVLRPIFLETGTYPMFSTDYQPMLATLMMQADGASIIHETLFSKRLGYLEVLEKFGLDYTLDDMCYGSACRFSSGNHLHSAILNGDPEGCATEDVDEIFVDTIRTGFAYIICALVSKKPITLTNVNLIHRGYENLEAKLESIGIKLEKHQPLRLSVAYNIMSKDGFESSEKQQ